MLEHLTKRFTINQSEIEKAAIKRVAPEIARLNTEKQLYQRGVDVRGQPLTPPYTARTKVIKARKGQPINRVTLRDTGELHKSIKVEPKDDAIYIEMFKVVGGDDIAEKLRQKYNQQFEGLMDESITELVTKVKPVFIELVKDALVTQ